MRCAFFFFGFFVLLIRFFFGCFLFLFTFGSTSFRPRKSDRHLRIHDRLCCVALHLILDADVRRSPHMQHTTDHAHTIFHIHTPSRRPSTTTSLRSATAFITALIRPPFLTTKSYETNFETPPSLVPGPTPALTSERISVVDRTLLLLNWPPSAIELAPPHTHTTLETSIL